MTSANVCVRALLHLQGLKPDMETSPPAAAEKKHKMDGSGFANLPKKLSATDMRGNVLFKKFLLVGCEPRCPVVRQA